MPSAQHLSRHRRRARAAASAGSRAGRPQVRTRASGADVTGRAVPAEPSSPPERRARRQIVERFARCAAWPWRSRGRLGPSVLLGVVTVALGGLAVWSGIQAHAVRDTAAGRNLALTDNAGTSRLKGEITSAVNTLFSYNYADVGKTERAARELLTGKAIGQYDVLLGAVRRQGPKDKLVLTTTVTDSGVTMLHGDRARVLIFADQRSTRTVDDQTSYAGTMLAVDAVSRDGSWKIANIDPLTGSAPR